MFNKIKGLFGGKAEPGTDSHSSPGAAAAQAKSEPISLQHVWTAEPNAVKLRVSRMLIPLGEVRAYPGPEQATESPLAQALFEIPGVLSVTIDSASVQVTLDEASDWDVLMERVPEAIKRHLDAGLTAVEGLDPLRKSAPSGEAPGADSADGKKYKFGFRQIPTGSRTTEEQKEIIQKLLDDEINPAVAAHGGVFSLVGIDKNNVYVQLGGGCHGCGMVDVTLRQGVEQRMKEVLPEMNALIDVTDHQAGENPFYQANQ